MFDGFSQDALTFLADLKANNNRAWFNDHKKSYEREIKGPAKYFCEEMGLSLEKLTGVAHRSKVFRINRDIRFSKDRTPYNAHLHISFIPEGEGTHPPHWFFGLEPMSLTIGVGTFAFEKQQLVDYRERVAGAEGKTLAKVLAKLEKGGVRLGKTDLKRVPSSYGQDHPQAELLKRKGLSVWIDYNDTKPALGNTVIKTLTADFKKLKPVYDWLNEL